jgi:hypothetical protein
MTQDLTGKWKAMDPTGDHLHWKDCKAWAAELERRKTAEKESARLEAEYRKGRRLVAKQRRKHVEELYRNTLRARTETAADGFEDDLPW